MCLGRIMSGEFDDCYCALYYCQVMYNIADKFIYFTYPSLQFSRRYDSFVNWDFFPSVQLPILVYFKETQTPKVPQIFILILIHYQYSSRYSPNTVLRIMMLSHPPFRKWKSREALVVIKWIGAIMVRCIGSPPLPMQGNFVISLRPMDAPR